MRKFLLFAVSILLFISCTKKFRKPCLSESNTFRIEITRENKAPLDIDYLYVAVSMDEYSNQYALLDYIPLIDSSFTVEIPKVLSKSYLRRSKKIKLTEFTLSPNIASENAECLIQTVWFLGFKDDKYVGQLVQTTEECGRMCHVQYIYSGAALDVVEDFESYPFNYKNNFTVEKGINQICRMIFYDEKPIVITITDTIPDNLEWFFKPNKAWEHY